MAAFCQHEHTWEPQAAQLAAPGLATAAEPAARGPPAAGEPGTNTGRQAAVDADYKKDWKESIGRREQRRKANPGEAIFFPPMKDLCKAG